jgi:hypothetical protein
MQDTDSSGTFYENSRLRTVGRSVLEPLHYRNLDEVTELAVTNTTAETRARYIQEAGPRLARRRSRRTQSDGLGVIFVVRSIANS